MKRDEVWVKVKTPYGREESFRAKGAMMFIEQRDQVGLFLTGDIQANRLAEALVMTMEQMAPGSDAEDLLLNFVMRVCLLAVRSEKVLDMMKFRVETAAMVNEILGAGGDKEDEGDE